MDGAATLGNAFAEELGDDAGETAAEHNANLVLFLGGKGVDNAVDGLRGVVGVECAEDEHAHRSAAEGEFDGLHLAHFAEENDVGVVAHRAFQGVRKGGGVFADLAVNDHTFFHRVDEFNGVLDGDDVAREVGVNVVDHRGERGRFAGAGGAGDDDEALVEVAEFFQRFGELERVEGKNFCRDLAEDGGLAPVIVKVIAAETGEAGDLVGEIEVLAVEEIGPAFGGTDFFEQGLHGRCVDDRVCEWDEGSRGAGFGREADGEVEVGAALFEHGAEEGVDGGHG